MAAAAKPREHGWFGHTTLVGGTGPNQLIGLGRPRAVQAEPSRRPRRSPAYRKKRTSDLNPAPPGGTYYKYVKGHLVPVIKF